MSTTPPASAPPPTSLPTPPTTSSPPPTNSTTPPAIPSAPPPAVPSAPPPAVPSSPPPAVPSAPPPAVPSAPPPAVPSTPPPAIPSAPPPAVPSSPPPATPSSPPPAVPSSPPPATPSSPPPAVPSSPPPATPSVPSPTTPSLPSPPPPDTVSPPAPVIPSPPGTVTPSPPAPGSTPSPPGSTPSPPAPVTRTPPAPSSGGGGTSPVSGAPPSTRSTPPPPTSTSFDSGGSGVSTPVVVGIVVGGAAILLVLALLFIFCKKKRRRGEPYYGGPPPRKEDGYGGQAQSWQQNAPPPADHAIKIPSNLSHPPGYASRPPQFPPPPPLMFSSSGASGSNYSGDPESPLPSPSPAMAALGFSKSTFTFEELVRATDGFSNANLLGQGGFGYVHRGILSNGKEVAVKQLKTGSGQGEREFQAEVEIISRVHHKHLVSLVGYCITGDKRLLVYEFVPNNTMEFHLHGKGRPTMDWPTRLKIALGSAKGLAYLHEDCHPKIIHRDIKAANILLDFKFEAMVADFGLAKFFSDNNTHVSTRVMGTFGYMAPEYASSGKLSEKSDVFSFGVVLLELVTGRRPVETTNSYMDDSLVDWARPLLIRAIEERNFDALVDPRLEHNYNPNEMAQMLACAAACVRHSARRRPRMSQIVRALEGDLSLDDLHEGGRPGNSSLYSSHGSSDYDTGMYNEDMKKFKKLALTSQEYASSEYSQPTSEYGQNPSVSSSEAQTREMEIEKMKKDSGGFV